MSLIRKLDWPIAKMYGGYGIGNIHEIMKKYGGIITVESKLGKGSPFHVHFPAVKEEALPL
jgi:sensor histidine kinase regulating citrate/malate metabolism